MIQAGAFSVLPTVSRVVDIGTMPSAADQQPLVGLKPTTPVMLAGIRHDPPAKQNNSLTPFAAARRGFPLLQTSPGLEHTDNLRLSKG